MIARLLLSAIFCLPALALSSTPEVTIYSVYEGSRLDPIFKPFTDRTGIKVTIVDGNSEDLIARLQTEGSQTKADLHLDKDLIYNGLANHLGLYKPFQSQIVEGNIPSALIEPNRNWFTVFYRARVIMYNRHKINPAELSTYEDLGNSKWKGRLCVRTSNNSYNEGLGAYFIHHLGAAQTLQLLSSWVKNFAIEPMKSDREVIDAVAKGVCDVGIANSYYLAPFVKADPDYAVRPFFPNQATTGAHINGVGIGLVKHAKNVAAATQVLEYLSSKEVQAPVASAFSQYPSNPQAALADVLAQFGTFKADSTNLDDISKHTDSAKSAIKKAGYR